MIRHSVILKFKDEISAADKRAFFAASRELANIQNVQKFEMLTQTSPKNKFEYGISMEFDNQEQYEIYNNHPDHQYFIQNFWIKYIADFLEIDYKLM